MVTGKCHIVTAPAAVVAEDHLYNAIHKSVSSIGANRVSSLIEATVRMMHQDDIPLSVENDISHLKESLGAFGADQTKKRKALLLDIAKEAWADHDRKRSKSNHTNEDAHVELEERNRAVCELMGTTKMEMGFLLTDTNFKK